jgi:FkbM family methyltransferase
VSNLPTLVNVPPFLIRDLKEKDLTLLKKIKLIIIGKFLGAMVKTTKGHFFCKIINIFFKNDGKIIYEDNQYIKIKNNHKVIHYPNKRILRVVKSLDFQLDLIIKSYCLDEIKFENNDIVIDCGANVGELNLALNKGDADLKYYAFEPDEETFESLKMNNPKNIDTLFKLGLSNESKKMNFFLDTEGGNSSIVDFGSKNVVEIQTSTLDSMQINKKIKLFKVEAEGYEPEVLEGAESTLRLIEYVSVDFGPERGEDSENTVIQVNNILTKAGFELIKFSNYRVIGLYRNKSI